jgi:hypothetical protein
MTICYSDELITLHVGDCTTIQDWLAADILVVDPPYGRGWKQGALHYNSKSDDSHAGITGDDSTWLRDWVLGMWGTARLAVVFWDLMLAPPEGTKQVLIYAKPKDAGRRGATGGFRRDAEAIYLLGPWPSGISGRSSVLRSGAVMSSGGAGLSHRYGHPHAKPVDVLEQLLCALPGPGTVADPCAGAGSTLVAARNLGLPAIGVEVDEGYATRAAERLSQQTLFQAIETSPAVAGGDVSLF